MQYLVTLPATVLSARQSIRGLGRFLIGRLFRYAKELLIKPKREYPKSIIDRITIARQSAGIKAVLIVNVVF